MTFTLILAVAFLYTACVIGLIIGAATWRKR